MPVRPGKVGREAVLRSSKPKGGDPAIEHQPNSPKTIRSVDSERPALSIAISYLLLRRGRNGPGGQGGHAETDVTDGGHHRAV